MDWIWNDLFALNFFGMNKTKITKNTTKIKGVTYSFGTQGGYKQRIAIDMRVDGVSVKQLQEGL